MQRHRHRSVLILAGAVIASAIAMPQVVSAGIIKTGADASLTENGGSSGATNGGNGSSTGSINVRWNFASNGDRNEWGAYKFDLSSIADKSQVQNVSFNTYMNRGNSNNSGKNLHLYALTPGTAGEDWNEAAITYDDMPGFTFDGNSTTNVLDVGGAVADLGTYQLPPSPALDTEGTVASVLPRLSGSDALTSLIQGMGSNNLLTILITYESSSNGTWNTTTREATQTSTGVLTGSAGDFASFLQFETVPEPSSLALLGLGGFALLRRRK